MLFVLLQDTVESDYCPDTCSDTDFDGLALGAELCRGHQQLPQKCVAFEGTNTGRRFYVCSVENVSSLLDFVLIEICVCSKLLL